jgi:hypothetical protein
MLKHELLQKNIKEKSKKWIKENVWNMWNISGEIKRD